MSNTKLTFISQIYFVSKFVEFLWSYTDSTNVIINTNIPVDIGCKLLSEG